MSSCQRLFLWSKTPLRRGCSLEDMRWGALLQSQPGASLLAPTLGPSYESLLSSSSLAARLLTLFQQGFSGHPTRPLFQPFVHPSLSRQLSQSRGQRIWCVESWETRWVTRAESHLGRGYIKQTGGYT